MSDKPVSAGPTDHATIADVERAAARLKGVAASHAGSDFAHGECAGGGLVLFQGREPAAHGFCLQVSRRL